MGHIHALMTPKLSDFTRSTSISLAHRDFATDFSKIGLDISTGMPAEDPELFPGWLSQTPVHQDLSISLRKKPLNLGNDQEEET